jgi:hypothetical protein
MNPSLKERSNLREAVLELAFVLRGVKVTLRISNQPVVVDLPKLVAADSNAFSSTAGSAVRPR